jgi:hypothetical protein
MKKIVYKSGACVCAPNRYIRFVIPRGVAGCPPVISCRENDGVGRESMREHALPPDVEVGVLFPGVP